MATSGQKFQKILFMASSCTYYEPNCGSTSLCDQNCGVQPADRQTDRITHTGIDKSLKTEGPKILSNDIFYFRTLIIGGPITERFGRMFVKTICWLYGQGKYYVLETGVDLFVDETNV